MSAHPMCCGDSPFFGCRFSLYPMTDSFAPIILDAVQEVRRPGIVVETDDISTCLVGVEPNVFAALRDCLIKISKKGNHVVLSATFSKGCPGEGTVNLADFAFPADTHFTGDGCEQEVVCQFSIYPLGNLEYMKIIHEVVDITKKLGVFAGSSHFCTRIGGKIEDVFKALEASFEHTTKLAGHTVMVATLSCNSPTKKQG